VACEGRFAAFVPASQASIALEILQAVGPKQGASQIGIVLDPSNPRVTLKSQIGSLRILDMHSGEQLPRIC
jgi:hydrogenase expression/formation protein HypE